MSKNADQSSSSSSADPLANIITQVSQTATGVPTKGGPARPTRVAKQGEKKKKKKESSGPTTSAPEAAPVASDTKADEEEQQSHSHKPSSTLVGTSTTKSSHIISQSESGKTQGDGSANADGGIAPSATSDDPVKEVRSSSKGANEAIDASKEKSGLGGKEKTLSGTQAASAGAASSPRSDGTSLRTAGEKTPSSRQSEKATGAGARRKKNKVGIVGKIIAILTCTSASGAAVVEEEEMSEKRATSSKPRNANAYGNGQKNGTSSATGLAAGQPASSRLSPRSAGVKGARAPSPRGSMDKTVGGGTRLPRDETGDVMSGAVVPPGSTFVVQEGDAKKGGTGGSGSSSMDKGGDDDGDEGGRGDDDDDDDDDEGEDGWMGDDQLDDDEDQTEEQRLILQGGAGIPRDEDGTLHPLLGPIHEQDHGRKCLVLDLDETLVHSSFKMISNADFTVPVEIEGTVHNVYVIKRPGVDEFMRKMGEIYEVVVFTASLSKYADPVLDILDIHQVVRHRLFRESCYNHRGNYVKDLSQLGRDIETSIIIDNSPASYIFHPNNAVPISSWFNDPHDTELTDLCPFLAELADVQDVRAVLDGGL